MTSKDEARQSSLLKTKLYCEQHSSIWNGDPSFTADFNEYRSLLDEISGYEIQHVGILLGYAKDKHNKEELVIKDSKFIGPRISTWASRPTVNRPDVKGLVKIADSVLERLADTILLTKAKGWLQVLDEHATIIPAYVTVARRNTFESNIHNYEDVLSMPKLKIKERALARQQMVKLIGVAMKFRRERLLDCAKLFRESDREFYGDFVKTIRIHKNPSRKLPLRGSVRDAETGETIAFVKVLIAEKEQSARSGEKGNFLFKSLAAGEYTLLFMKYGYETVKKTIFVNDGERTEVEAEMKKNVYAT